MNIRTVYGLLVVLLFVSCTSSNPKDENSFVYVKNGQFIKNGKPYYFLGTNYWYGALLGRENGDRERLLKELDFLKANGVDNLRVLVGAETGSDTLHHRVREGLQTAPGVYDQSILLGLDFFMAELAKRDMQAVLYMNNNWIWSGGMAQYLEWFGYGDIPNPFLPEHSWDEFMKYNEQFHSCQPCMDAYSDHLRFIMSRTNSITGVKYTDDPTVFSWQVANEPRPWSYENEAAFTQWLFNTVELMDSLAPNQMISTGAEGEAGSIWDIDVFARTHDNPAIDYLTMHIWPKNWGWYQVGDSAKTLQKSMELANAYFDRHIALAKSQNKPIVLSEFGFPRDNEDRMSDSPYESRLIFYENIMSKILEGKAQQSAFAGLNFWAFSGYAVPDADRAIWQRGDDFAGDPPQEPQGLNGVYASDSLLWQAISHYNQKLAE